MKIELTPGGRSAARRLAGQFQRTFETPLDRLPAFTNILLPDESPVASGVVFLDAVIFEPTRLSGLLAAHAVAEVPITGSTITADGLSECRSLLTAALGDAVDFCFSPDPRQFFLYADHDEYVTLFAHKRGRLSQIAEALAGMAVKEVAGYERSL